MRKRFLISLYIVAVKSLRTPGKNAICYSYHTVLESDYLIFLLNGPSAVETNTSLYEHRAERHFIQGKMRLPQKAIS